MRRAVSAALIALLAILPAVGNAKSSLDQRIQQQREKQRQVQSKLHQKRGELNDARSRFLSARDQLDAANHNIQVAQASLAELQTQMRWNQKRIEWNQVQLDAAKTTLKRHTDALNRRLVDAYEHGELGYLTVLLSATSFSDFVERWDDIRMLVSANQSAVRERKFAEGRVIAAEQALLGDRARLNQSAAGIQQKQSQLASLADQRRQLVIAADAEKNHVAQEVNDLEETSAEAETAIEELIREKQREAEAANAVKRRAALLNGEEPPPILGAPGALSWPVSGRISSPYGMRNNPVTHRFIMHTGIDIAVEMGTTVLAPAEGRVISAGWNDGGYGNMIILDHGGSMSTLYGHLSQIFVGVGQEIKKGQAIGAAGSTGNSTGPHVHFEVRIEGRTVDPMSYLH